MTLEGWSSVMVMVQRSFNVLAFLFFVPLVFLGAFFLLNLTLAVIKSEFTKEQGKIKSRLKAKGRSPEEIKNREEREKRWTEKKLKPFRKKIQQILDRVRIRLAEKEERKLKFCRPVSFNGVFSKEVFNDDEDRIMSKSRPDDKKHQFIKDKSEKKYEESKSKTNLEGVEKMEEESSYEMSSIGNSVNSKDSEESNNKNVSDEK